MTNIIKTYNSPTSSYSIVQLDSNSVQAHCDAYIDYVSLANNAIYDELEIEDLLEKMQASVSTGTAFSVEKDGIELGYMYLSQVSNFKFYISVLHTYDIDSDPIPKLLLIQEVYDNYPDARYYPKDIYSMQNIALLDPVSYRIFRQGSKEYIRLKRPLWDNSLFTYLNLV